MLRATWAVHSRRDQSRPVRFQRWGSNALEIG